MQTAPATSTTRDVYERMVRREADTLNWQREHGEDYATIWATMTRIHELNMLIAATIQNRPSAYQTNWR